MFVLDDYTLISGGLIHFTDNCTLRQPTLGDIRDVGIDQYHAYLSTLLMTKDSLTALLQIKKSDELEKYSVYDIMGAIPDLQSLFIQALSFFVREEVGYDQDMFTVNGHFMLSSELSDICQVILKFSYITTEDKVENHKFASEKARLIWEKIQKKKAEFRKAKKEDQNMDISNLIGAICAKHSSYNLLNIWELTVYQLYDQFARINVNAQMDVYGLRWAAWGKDDWDFKWFKKLDNKGE